MIFDALQQKLRGILPDSELVSTALNLCPEISLYLLKESYPQHLLSREQTQNLMDNPPYWCFCWASGDVLARTILDKPELVKGKVVIDFGAGSGVAGIAAAKAGAKQVICCDLDLTAQMACQINAQLNKVDIVIKEDISQLEKVDLILLADVLYDRENLIYLEQLERLCDELIMADSRIPDFKRDAYFHLGKMESSTWPDLDESASFRHVNLFKWHRNSI